VRYGEFQSEGRKDSIAPSAQRRKESVFFKDSAGAHARASAWPNVLKRSFNPTPGGVRLKQPVQRHHEDGNTNRKGNLDRRASVLAQLHLVQLGQLILQAVAFVDGFDSARLD